MTIDLLPMLDIEDLADTQAFSTPGALPEGCSQLYQYWLNARGSFDIPPWANFKYVDLYRIASHLIVIDVDPDLGVKQASYRYVGTGIVALRRLRGLNDPTGEHIQRASRAYDRQKMDDAYNRCAFEGKPIYLRGPYEDEFHRGSHARLILPWSIEGRIQRLTLVVDKFPDVPYEN